MSALTLDRIYVGALHGCKRPWDRGPRAFVLGDQFGAKLLVAGEDLDEAFDEFDERFGRRVDFVADARDMADYDGATVAEQVESAMNGGDIRINDGGTTVWVDHYEWCREFDTIREAGAFYRQWGKA